MWPDRVSNPGHLALESDALPTALRGPAVSAQTHLPHYSRTSKFDHRCGVVGWCDGTG